MPNTVAMSVSETVNENGRERGETGRGETGTGSVKGRGGDPDHWTGNVSWKAVAEKERRRNTDLAGRMRCLFW